METAKRPIFISHRGESSIAPENTIAAFKYAMDNGSDGMETDIRLTSDGVVVCSHDGNLKRGYGADMVVEEHTLAEIRQCRALLHADRFPGQTVPTFAEALATLRPGRLFYVEVKADNTALVDGMDREIHAAGVPAGQIVVISFYENAIAYCKQKYPQYRALWLTAFEKDQNTGKFLHDIGYYVNILKACHADGVDANANLEFIGPDFARALKDAGMQFDVWTVDDTAAAREFIALGVDGITSNCALKLAAELR